MNDLLKMQKVNTFNEQFEIIAKPVHLENPNSIPELAVVDEDGATTCVYLTEDVARWLVRSCWVLYGPKWMGVSNLKDSDVRQGVAE